MQQKKETISNFIERTDRLAYHTGLTLRELAPKIGVSEATLFGCRGGKIPVSLKTWSKLEMVEVDEGLRNDPMNHITPSMFIAANDKESASSVNEPQSPYPNPKASFLETLQTDINRVEQKLDRLLKHLGLPH